MPTSTYFVSTPPLPADNATPTSKSPKPCSGVRLEKASGIPTGLAEWMEEEEDGVVGNEINPGGSDPRESKPGALGPDA